MTIFVQPLPQQQSAVYIISVYTLIGFHDRMRLMTPIY
jgi:hypothetical protein